MAEKEMRNTVAEKMRLRRNIESSWLIYMRSESGSEERKREKEVQVGQSSEQGLPCRIGFPSMAG